MNLSLALIEILFTMFATALLGILGWIAVSLNKMSEKIAVFGVRIENHDKRITILENDADS